MDFSHRIDLMHQLGSYLESFINNYHNNNSLNNSEQECLNAIKKAKIRNPWFTVENVVFGLKEWSKVLKKEALENWLSSYLPFEQKKTIGIIAAGNIPMVGFHDILSVFMSGNIAQVKLSSNDNVLIPFFIQFLSDLEPKINERIVFVEKLQNYDGVIATGSDNTSRYFEHYFGKHPHIIRKNRTSVAVLDGTESEEELNGLATDIFRYFGLGCRNVTQLFLPKEYDLDQLFQVFYDWKEVINHHKYANNYDYYRALYMMKKEDFLENGFLLVKKSDALYSPIATLNYHSYQDEKEIENYLKSNMDKIQCVVGKKRNIAFGQTQSPTLDDYADGVNTINFLKSV